MSLVVLLACLVWPHAVSSQLYNDTLFAVLADHVHLTTFLGHAGETGLNLTLKDPYERLAVFAPSNAAFQQLPDDLQKRLKDDLDLLTDVMAFHFCQGHISLTVDNSLCSSLAHGANLRVNVYSSPNVNLTTVTGIEVAPSKALAAHNGVAYVMDKVLFPIPTENALSFLAVDDKFSKLSLALTKAGVTSLLTAHHVTILAPDDAAFDKLPPGFFSDLLNDVPLLTKVLKNHVIQGVWYSAYFRAAGGGSMTTMAAQLLNVTVLDRNSSLLINMATVTEPDVSVTNGVVHVIDHLLLP